MPTAALPSLAAVTEPFRVGPPRSGATAEVGLVVLVSADAGLTEVGLELVLRRGFHG